MPSEKAKKKLVDYNEKYKNKAILEIIYKDPSKVQTIVENQNLSLEEKTLGLLDRGIPSQHIPLLLDIVGEFFKEIQTQLEEWIKEEITIFEKLDDPWTQVRIDNTMQEALLFISEGKWVEAEKNLIEILRRNTKQSIAHFGMGICSDMQGMKNSAAEWFKRAYNLDPVSFNQARFMIGLL